MSSKYCKNEIYQKSLHKMKIWAQVRPWHTYSTWFISSLAHRAFLNVSWFHRLLRNIINLRLYIWEVFSGFEKHLDKYSHSIGIESSFDFWNKTIQFSYAAMILKIKLASKFNNHTFQPSNKNITIFRSWRCRSLANAYSSYSFSVCLLFEIHLIPSISPTQVFACVWNDVNLFPEYVTLYILKGKLWK